MLLIRQDSHPELSEGEHVIAQNMDMMHSMFEQMGSEAHSLRQQMRDQLIAQLKQMGMWEEPKLPQDYYFYHCNHLGLPDALTDKTGQVVWAAEYDPWGNLQSEHNPENLKQNIRLPGQYHDTDTGLYYNRHRYYDPKLGRYINQDPIGLNSGEPNFYAYPKNPVQGMDPLGLWEGLYGFTQAPGNQAALSKAMAEREIALRRLRTATCPATAPKSDPDWVSYNTVGDPNVFHCGFDGYLANVPALPDNLMNECFYDESGSLVDESHEYANCAGTPDQYNGKTDPIKHIFIDSGGIVRKGFPAGLESIRHRSNR